ncbi:fluoride efflux transporter CrcB [Spirochaetota bacterium]
MKHIIFIAIGGGLGAVLRYIISKNIHTYFNQILPFGTLFVNASGSFLIGFLFYFFENLIVSNDVKSFFTIGFLGAYTTFSTYSFETINLIKDGEIKLGLINLCLNNLLSLFMVITGMLVSRFLFKIIR